jgi:hypothetical protein
LTAAGLLLAAVRWQGNRSRRQRHSAAVTEAATMVGTAVGSQRPNGESHGDGGPRRLPNAIGETALYFNRRMATASVPYFSAQFDPNRPGRILQRSGRAGRAECGDSGVFLDISLNGPPEGMDSRQYAAKWLELYAPGMPLEGQEASIGGQTAEVVGNLPGFTAQRGAFIVTPEGRYTVPDPATRRYPRLTEHASRVWETVRGR